MGTTFSSVNLLRGRPDDRVVKERVQIQQIMEEDLIGHPQQGVHAPSRGCDDEMVEDSSEIPLPVTPDRQPEVDAQEPSVTLDEAAEAAFQRYQHSVVEATADQGRIGGATGAQQEVEPAVSRATPPAVQKGKKRSYASTGAARGDPFRSPKKKTRPLPWDAEETEPSKARQQEEQVDQHEPAPAAKAAAAHAAQTSGPAGGRQAGASKAAMPVNKKARRRSSVWKYMRPEAREKDTADGDLMTCPDGRSYPCSLAYKEGDIRLHDYLGKTDDDQLYELEYIVDERRRGAVRQFRVKWKGFELNPEEWLKYNNVKECAVLDKWEAELGMLQPSEA